MKDVEEIIAEMDYFDENETDITVDNEYRITISGWYVDIPGLGLVLREGMFCNWDEDEQYYVSDFSITLVFENAESNTYLYYEQDGFGISLANYLHSGITLTSIEDMICNLYIQDIQ